MSVQYGARYIRSKRKLTEEGDLLITARDKAKAKGDAVGFTKATIGLGKFLYASSVCSK